MDLRQVSYRNFEGIYRDKAVRVWGEHKDDGFRRIKRWWNFETCGETRTHIRDFETAKRLARDVVDREIDGDPWVRWQQRQWFRWHYLHGDEPELEPEHEPCGVPEKSDRQAELREKLKQMTVERGCTQAEADTARKKLEALERSTQ